MIEAMNSDCFCISLDREALRQAIEADPALEGLSALIEERCPHLFAALPVFVSRSHVEEMARIIAAVEEVVGLRGYQEEVLSRAPDIARLDPGARGVFVGYDFHLGARPKLIEINTNAGGALLNGLLGRAQRACCEDVARPIRRRRSSSIPSSFSSSGCSMASAYQRRFSRRSSSRSTAGSFAMRRGASTSCTTG